MAISPHLFHKCFNIFYTIQNVAFISMHYNCLKSPRLIIFYRSFEFCNLFGSNLSNYKVISKTYWNQNSTWFLFKIRRRSMAFIRQKLVTNLYVWQLESKFNLFDFFSVCAIFFASNKRIILGKSMLHSVNSTKAKSLIHKYQIYQIINYIKRSTFAKSIGPII